MKRVLFTVLAIVAISSVCIIAQGCQNDVCSPCSNVSTCPAGYECPAICPQPCPKVCPKPCPTVCPRPCPASSCEDDWCSGQLDNMFDYNQ